jgi:ankyrin repeat protein
MARAFFTARSSMSGAIRHANRERAMPTFADLQTAIREKNAARVREILAAAPDLAGSRPRAGPSALLLAAYLGGGEIAEALRSRVAMDACEAAALGALDALTKLLDEHPVRTNARSGDGWTPLHLAGFFGRREIADKPAVPWP